MMSAAQYGHVIKHLEVHHLEQLAVPLPVDRLAEDFNRQSLRVLELRNKAYELSVQAERKYAACFPSYKFDGQDPVAATVAASRIFSGRKRLDANCYAPVADRILRAFALDARDVQVLSDLTKRVFVPGRFKHVYGDGGMPYLDSADVLEVNPDVTKFVLSLSEKEQIEYFVGEGWLLIPCSGQVYGNLGQSVLTTEAYTGKVYTNHLLRIVPNEKIRSGYLQCVLSHPLLGRPLITRFAFGSSVPELSPGDIATISIPRLARAVEELLADLWDAAAKARDEADELERELAHKAEVLIDQFLSGDSSSFRDGL
jgi:hypothetical protein